MKKNIRDIQTIILKAANQARLETKSEPEPEIVTPPEWPLSCTVGPGLEGAIACESKIGYVNGSKGWLIYRGYDVFDLCAYSSFEEVSYLLLHGRLPGISELNTYSQKLFSHSRLNKTLRVLMGFPVEEMNVMAVLRLGTNLMRQEFTNLDRKDGWPETGDAIGADEDSIAMETKPTGSDHAIYEFKPAFPIDISDDTGSMEACYHLIAGVSSIVGAISRIHSQMLPLESHPDLSFAANLLYMMTGRIPTPVEERIMDVCLILHADHGMNASTFAAMVVASTFSDFYSSVGAGIGALSGPLHGGANEAVIHNLKEIGTVDKVAPWIRKKLKNKNKISGFGHRVYKAYDPRARILGPLAQFLVKGRPEFTSLYNVASELEKNVIFRLSKEKKIFPNVDFYSGIVYSCLGIEPQFFTPLFAASRVAGWTARVFEYMQNNRIFRPRAIYTGEFNQSYIPIEKR